MTKLKLAMIGGGIDAFIGAVHRMASRLDDHWVVVAGALSSTPARSKESGTLLGLPQDRIYGTWQELIAKESARPDRVDAIAIVTPNFMHAEPAIAALQAGFHVICDKPLTVDLQTAHAIERAVEQSGKYFFLTHTYAGYPLVKQARQMVAAGDLGNIRLVQVEYPQGWLAQPEEQGNNKQAAWRTDPQKSGAAGSIGDIGTHAFHLAEYVSGLSCKRLLAQLDSFVDGRQVDDNAQILLDFAPQSSGTHAKGMIWVSQVAIGQENGLKLSVFGDKGSIIWVHESPNRLEFATLNAPTQIITRGGSISGDSSAASIPVRVPAGHPEGYIEAFAQLYTDAALTIHGQPILYPVPSVHDGVRGLQFITACLQSNQHGNGWADL